MTNFRSTIRAVCGAFLPASVTVWGLVLATVVIREPRALGAIGLRTAVMEWLLFALGYGVGWLWLPHRHGRRLATSRHHSLAGVLTPLTMLGLSVVVHQPTTAGIVALSFASGSIGALLQWLLARRVPPPPAPSLEEREAVADLALAQALQERADIVPLTAPDRIRKQQRVGVA